MDQEKIVELATVIAERVYWALDLSEGEEITVKDIVSDELLEVL